MVHLPGVGVREAAELEIDDHQAPQHAVKKQQVDAIPLVVDPLPGDEGEVVAQLEKKVFEMFDQCLFEVGFGILVLEAEELEDQRALISSSAVKRSPGWTLPPLASSDPFFRDKAVRS